MFFLAIQGCEQDVWTLFLHRIIDEMSPAYLVFVGLIYVAVKLGYRYLSHKIDTASERERSFLSLLQEALRVISELDETLDQLHGKVDSLRGDHEEVIETLNRLKMQNELPPDKVNKATRKKKNESS